MDDNKIIIQKQNYKIYLISKVIVALSSGIFGPFYILFVQQKGKSIESFGMALGLLLLTQSIISYFAGKYSDIFGRKPFLIIEGYLSSIIVLLYLFITGVWQLYFLQIANGLLGGIGTAVGPSFLADITEKKTRGKMIGKYKFSIGIATAITMMFSGYLVALTSIKTIFIIMAMTSAISTTLLFFIKENRE